MISYLRRGRLGVTIGWFSNLTGSGVVSMPMRLSAKGFAEFVVLGPAKKAQIVRNVIKPQSAEAKIITQYYSQAIKTIRIYHDQGNDRKYLAKIMRSLEKQLESSATSQGRSKIQNNLRALHEISVTDGSGTLPLS